jgi:hypothetical protein
MKVNTGIKAGFNFALANVHVTQIAGALAPSIVVGSGNRSGGGAGSVSEAVAANSSNNLAVAVAR